jgi:hypothetical protein
LGKLNIKELDTTKTIKLTLADNSVMKSYGVIEDVLVNVKDLVFPVDFVILDMKEDEEAQVILGRPLLAISSTFIDMLRGEILLKMGDEECTIKVYREKHNQFWKIEVRKSNDVSSPSEGEKEICELEEEMSQLTIKARKEESHLELSKQMAKLAITKAKENSSWVTRWGKHRKVATKVVRIEFLS